MPASVFYVATGLNSRRLLVLPTSVTDSISLHDNRWQAVSETTNTSCACAHDGLAKRRGGCPRLSLPLGGSEL